MTSKIEFVTAAAVVWNCTASTVLVALGQPSRSRHPKTVLAIRRAAREAIGADWPAIRKFARAAMKMDSLARLDGRAVHPLPLP